MEMGSRSSEEGSGAGGTGRSESSRLLRGVCPVPGARGGWMWAHGFAGLSPGGGAVREARRHWGPAASANPVP